MHTTDGAARKSPRSGNPVLEKETQRLVTLKRRQAMELQQMLAFELRSLAREVNRAVTHGSFPAMWEMIAIAQL